MNRLSTLATGFFIGSATAYAVMKAVPSPSTAVTEVKASHPTPNANIRRIALTGGPCGGKSSSLKNFSQRLAADGIDVYTVPEVPTILLTNGCKFPGIEGDRDALMAFEKAVLDTQMALEDSFLTVANSTGRPSVVVMDRGLMDIAAYMPPHLWSEVLAETGNDEKTFKARYDMVLHLVTAADGAEEFYTTANNAARSETAEEARALDQKMQACWSHPHLKVVGNNGSFKDKLKEATGHVVDLVAPIKPK